MENSAFIISLLVTAWNGKVAQAEGLFDQLGPAHAGTVIVPCGNSVLYLTGHLTVVNDRLLEGMNLEARLCPEWDAMFLQPFDPAVDYPSYEEVRVKWNDISERLITHFHKMQVGDWLGKHHYVSAEDFEKEPHRNVLNLLISRTGHLANHIGQLILAKTQAGN